MSAVARRETKLPVEDSQQMRRVWLCAARGGSYVHGTAADKQQCDADVQVVWARNTRLLASTQRSSSDVSGSGRQQSVVRDWPSSKCVIDANISGALEALESDARDPQRSLDFSRAARQFPIDVSVSYIDRNFKSFFDVSNVSLLDVFITPGVVVNPAVCSKYQWDMLVGTIIPNALHRHGATAWLLRGARGIAENATDDSVTRESRDAVIAGMPLSDSQASRAAQQLKDFSHVVHKALRAIYIQSQYRHTLQEEKGGGGTWRSLGFNEAPCPRTPLEVLQSQFDWATLLGSLERHVEVCSAVKSLLDIRQSTDINRWLLEFSTAQQRKAFLRSLLACAADDVVTGSWDNEMRLDECRAQVDVWLYELAAGF